MKKPVENCADVQGHCANRPSSYNCCTNNDFLYKAPHHHDVLWCLDVMNGWSNSTLRVSANLESN